MKLDPLKAKTIAEFCKAIRERENRSMREFGERFEIHWTQVGKAESGKDKKPLAYLKYLYIFMSDKERMHLLDLLLAD